MKIQIFKILIVLWAIFDGRLNMMKTYQTDDSGKWADWGNFLGFITKDNESKELIKVLFGENYSPQMIKVGEGSFGQAYVVLDTRDSTLHILKVTKEIGNAVLRAELEADLLKNKLNDENIIKVEDYREIDESDNFYQIMEYGQSGNLIEARKKNPELFKNFLFLTELFLGIASGIRYLKNKKIVHTDIKPQNIVLTAENIAKIIDFELYVDLNYSHNIRGTSLYMDPRLIQPKKPEYDEYVDIYSFGITMYMMLHELNDYSKQLKKDYFEKLNNFFENGRFEDDLEAKKTIDYLIYRCCLEDATKRPKIDDIVSELETMSKQSDIFVIPEESEYFLPKKTENIKKINPEGFETEKLKENLEKLKKEKKERETKEYAELVCLLKLNDPKQDGKTCIEEGKPRLLRKI